MVDKNLNINIIAKDKSKQALGKLQGNLGKTKASVLNLKNALIGLGAGLVIRSIIQTTATFQDLRTSLASVTGSAQAGAEAFDFITGIATKTQFSVEDLSRSFIKLKAAGITPSEELLNIFTNTAAITTDQIGSLEAVTDLFARTVSGGLGLEEIQRLGDRGVPILRILEQELNLNRSQISEFGKSAEGAKKIVEAFGRGIQKEFGGATVALLDNLNVSFSNFGIALRNVQDKIGQGMSPALKGMTDELTRMLEENEELAIALGAGLGSALGNILTVTLKTVEAFDKLNTKLEDNGTYKILGGSAKDLLVDFMDLGFGLGTLREEFPELAKKIDELTNTTKPLSKGFISAEDSANAFQESMKKIIDVTKEVAVATVELTEAVYDKKLLAIQDSFLDERQLILKKNEEDKAIINKFLEEETNLTIGQKNELEDLKVAIYERGIAQINELRNKERDDELKHNAELAKISQARFDKNLQAIKDRNFKFEDLDKMSNKQKKELAKQGGREVLDEFAKNNKAAFAINKAFKIKDAIIDGVAGVQKALAMGPFGIPLAIAIGALTAANVATIASTNYTGRRTGGEVTAGRPYMVGEQGQEMFVPNQSGTIVPNDRLSGGQTINVNIHANDTQGFDELLIKRRATIVNVINDALNSQGKEALV